MKNKILAVILLALGACLCLCAFTLDTTSSVKTLTKPYITTYECTFARFGDEDLLEKYDYLKITFLDDKQLEVSFKRRGGKKRSYACDYSYDDKTREFQAEVGIFGFRFKQATKIENGKFTINMPVLGKPLVMRFAS